VVLSDIDHQQNEATIYEIQTAAVIPENVLVYGKSFPLDFPELGKERKRIKVSKFTGAQKAFIIKQGEEGAAVAEICRKAGISVSGGWGSPGFQVDGLKFQGSRSSMRFFGWPAAMASSDAFR
jgi:hypothetical protein